MADNMLNLKGISQTKPDLTFSKHSWLLLRQTSLLPNMEMTGGGWWVVEFFSLTLIP